MMFGSRLRRRTLVTSALVLAALTACNPGSEGTGADPSGDGGTPDDSAPDSRAADEGGSTVGMPDAATTTSLVWGQSSLTVGVRPIVRVQERLVLTLDVQADGATGDLAADMARELGHFWSGGSVDDLARPSWGCA